MTTRMVSLANTFSDVLILDTTHKTNRFNLPLLDIIVINNLGRSCTCFVALLENQKKESILWALKAFKEKLTQTPKVIFSDEDEAILGNIILDLSFSNYIGLNEVFPDTKDVQ